MRSEQLFKVMLIPHEKKAFEFYHNINATYSEHVINKNICLYFTHMSLLFTLLFTFTCNLFMKQQSGMRNLGIHCFIYLPQNVKPLLFLS